MPPKKRFEDTWRGKVQRKKEEMAHKKEAKEREKQEKAALAGQGLCRGPDGEVYMNAEVGRKFGYLGREDGKKTWDEADEEEREMRIEAGRKGAAEALANHGEEELELQRQVGRQGWNELSEVEKERCIEDSRNWWHGLNNNQQHGFSEARK